MTPVPRLLATVEPDIWTASCAPNALTGAMLNGSPSRHTTVSPASARRETMPESVPKRHGSGSPVRSGWIFTTTSVTPICGQSVQSGWGVGGTNSTSFMVVSSLDPDGREGERTDFEHAAGEFRARPFEKVGQNEARAGG